MNVSLREVGVCLFLASNLVTTTGAAQAQTGGAGRPNQSESRPSDQAYPSKPVRLVVPFPAGSTTDGISRIVGQKLSEVWGQQVVVENRTGAGGAIATESVARGASDGYTILMGGTGILALSPTLERKLSYDPVKDFAPITLVGAAPNLLVLHPSVPAKSLKDLIAFAKSQPGVVNFGSAGNGTFPHVAGEIFAAMASIKIVHVPYKSGDKTALLAGHIHMLITGIPFLQPHIKSGRLRAIGITSGKRSELLPAVPTIAESGLAGYDFTPWFGLLAPAKTQASIVNRLNAGLIQVLHAPALREQLREDGIELIGNSPEQFFSHIKSEMAKYAQGVKRTGVRFEE